MSLVVFCKSCRARLKDHDAPCPGCGADEKRYCISYFPDGRNGKRVRIPIHVNDIGFARFAEAEIRAGALEGRKPGFFTKSLSASTVSDLWQDYLKWFKDRRAALTLKDVESVYDNHLKDLLGHVPVMALNDHHFTAYQHSRKGAGGVSNRTINKELDYFRGFCRWCRKEKKLEIRPIVYEPLPYAKPLPIVLSPGEVVAIIEAAEPFYAAFFIFLYSLGLRKAEAQNLKWKDVDFANKQIRVIQKGGSWKILPLNDWAEVALDAMKAQIKGELVLERYVFASKRGGGKKPIQNVRPAIERACKKAGITKYVHPHLFRHSVATHFMAGGVNMRMIQQFLGHKDQKATAFYTHVSLDHLRGVTERFFPGVSAENGAK